MSPSQAMGIIETYIAAQWSGAAGTIAYPNVAFTPPATETWLKFDYIWGAGFIVTKDGRNATVCVLQLAVFGSKDQGDGGSLGSAADQVRGLFNRKRFASPNEDLVFGAASGPLPRNEESWRSLILSAPFQVYETA